MVGFLVHIQTCENRLHCYHVCKLRHSPRPSSSRPSAIHIPIRSLHQLLYTVHACIDRTAATGRMVSWHIDSICGTADPTKLTKAIIISSHRLQQTKRVLGFRTEYSCFVCRLAEKLYTLRRRSGWCLLPRYLDFHQSFLFFSIAAVFGLVVEERMARVLAVGPPQSSVSSGPEET